MSRLTDAWKTLWLDLKTIPLLHLKIMGKKEEYAKRHLREICAHCPQSRKLTRDVEGNGTCWWYENWTEGNYDIPADFGVVNWIRFNAGQETKLDTYDEKLKS
ncbi:MAG: hypothetical protein ACTSPB_01070 [Candidatus Thorarchaeota archaeon]